MKKVALAFAFTVALIPSPTQFASAEPLSNDRLGEAAKRSAHLVESIVKSPFYIIGDTVSGGVGAVKYADNVLLFLPGSLIGCMQGIDDALNAPIDALRGTDLHTYSANKWIL